MKVVLFLLLLLLVATASAQPPSRQMLTREQLDELLDKNDCANFPEVKVCKYDFVFAGKNVEALTFLPTGNGPFPGLLLIPGHERTARDQILGGNAYARAGFACVAVSQPGYGKSEGPADFVGPKTIKTLLAVYQKFQRESFVDAKRMGIYGYSRGGMAASLLAVSQLEGLRGVVLGAGVYDFKKAYDELTIEGIRENMKAETGLTPEAIKLRSSVLQMEKLNCPVLILHGEKDANVPVSQALLLRDRLTALKKTFEIKLYPDKDHGLDAREVIAMSQDFFQRHVLGEAPKK